VPPTSIGLGAAHRRMQGAGAGMPDLVLWRTAAAAAAAAATDPPELQGRRLCLVEVKGPHDRVSDEQRFFIDQLEEAHLPVVLCQVAASTPSTTTTPTVPRRL